MTRRRFLRLMAGSALLLSGCGAALSAPRLDLPRSGAGVLGPRVAAGPIRLGVIAPRAGIARSAGIAGLRATEWWVERTNRLGGILGRRVELVVEEESDPAATVDRFIKLVHEDRVEAVFGVCTSAVALALAPVAEEMAVLLLMWDGTTQDGLRETMPNPRWVFRSTDYEAGALAAAVLCPTYFRNAATIVGMNTDDAYGRASWSGFKAAMGRLSRLGMMAREPRFPLELFTEPGATDFEALLATVREAKPDLLFSSFRHDDAPILLKQAYQQWVLDIGTAVFSAAGGVADALKKRFVPERVLIGYGPMYFANPLPSPLQASFVADYRARYNEHPPYIVDNAYFVAEAFKTAVNTCYEAEGRWPSAERIAATLEGITVQSLSGSRSYRDDHVMTCDLFAGPSTVNNPYDVVTPAPLHAIPTSVVARPRSDVDLMEWVDSWRPGIGGLPVGSLRPEAAGTRSQSARS